MASQTYGHIQHVIIDGGSTDGTVDLLASTPQILWVSEVDHGQGQAINKGFRLAAGSILGWLNADDTLSSDTVELVVQALRSDPSIGWFYGDCLLVSDTTTRLLTPPPILTSHTFDDGNVVPQPGSFYSRSALEKVGFLDEQFELSMDFDLWLRFVRAGITARYLPQTLARFEIHEDSKTGKVSEVEFLKEEFLAFLKVGLVEAASCALGRAAARAALRNGRVGWWALRKEARNMANYGVALDHRIPTLMVKGAARAEAAALELPRSVRGLRHLLAASPWLYSSSLAKAQAVLKTALWYLLRRVSQVNPRHPTAEVELETGANRTRN